MKDEELFKAWKSEQYKDQSTEEKMEFVEHLHTFPKYFEKTFLAGLKAGRPQWHDLEKDPTDLPKEDCQVITVGKSPRRLLIKKVAYYLKSEKKFTIWNKEYENFTNLHRVIAWCEIPTFDKE